MLLLAVVVHCLVVFLVYLTVFEIKACYLMFSVVYKCTLKMTFIHEN